MYVFLIYITLTAKIFRKLASPIFGSTQHNIDDKLVGSLLAYWQGFPSVKSQLALWRSSLHYMWVLLCESSAQ